MKTNWPDEAIDRVLAERDPRRGATRVGPALDSDARTLLSRILAVDTAAARSATSGGTRWRAARFERRHVGGTPRPLRLRAAAVGLGAVVAATVAVGLVVTSGRRTPPPHHEGHAAATAASVLRKAALVADVQPAPPPLRPNQFVYTDEIDVDLGGSSKPGMSGDPEQTDFFWTVQKITRQTWLAPDRAGRIAETSISRRFLTPDDRQRWIEAGSPSFASVFPLVNGTSGPGTFGPFVDLSKLPTNPKVLAEQMHVGKIDEIGLDPDEFRPPVVHPPLTVFENIGDLLGETDASPALRSALYQVAAGLPGVKLLGTVTDSVGRRGTAVAYERDGETNELIFDPTTSALLEDETIVTDASALTNEPDTTPVGAPRDTPAGTVVESATYLARGVVNSTAAVPSATTPDTTNGSPDHRAGASA